MASATFAILGVTGSDSDLLHEQFAHFEVVGMPRNASIPVYDSPNGKELTTLSQAEIFRLDVIPGTLQPVRTDWFQIGHFHGKEGWVRRQDISFDPSKVKNPGFSQPGGDPFWEYFYDDLNNDGYQEILWQYEIDMIVFPSAYVSFAYTLRRGIPLPLLKIIGESSPLRPIAQPSGGIALVNRKMIWRQEGYLWQDGQYRLLPIEVSSERWKTIREELAPWWMWLPGLAVAWWLLHMAQAHGRRSMAEGFLSRSWKQTTLVLWICFFIFTAATLIIVVPIAYEGAALLFLELILPVWATSCLYLLVRLIRSPRKGKVSPNSE